jgi:hypothetical protein
MHHGSLNDVEEMRFLSRIRPCCSDDCVHLFCCCWLKVGRKRKEEMHVRKSTLLEFDSVNISIGETENVGFGEVIDQ